MLVLLCIALLTDSYLLTVLLVFIFDRQTIKNLNPAQLEPAYLDLHCLQNRIYTSSAKYSFKLSESLLCNVLKEGNNLGTQN